MRSSPTIARWPGTIQPGVTSTHIAAFWDLLPTVCQITGADIPENIDGLSFLPALLSQPEQQKEHEYLYWEFHENPTTEQAVRMGTWKAVRHAPSGAIELYDLRQDIGEENNVATEHADIVNRVKDYLDKSRTPHEIWPLKD